MADPSPQATSINQHLADYRSNDYKLGRYFARFTAATRPG
jgi:hypothetical protein